MNTIYRIPILIMILLLAACAANAPEVVQPQQPAVATETDVPPTPLPPLSTPTPEPATAPAPAPAALADYSLSAQVTESSDQAWQAVAVRGEITARNPDGEDFNRITALRKDGSQRWVHEYDTKHGLGEGIPAGFRFSSDGKFLYFYDRITSDGCGAEQHGFLRRMDLASGQVEPLQAFSREGRFFLAPDGLVAAEVVDSQIRLTNLESGAETNIPLTLPYGGDLGYGDLLWSNDSKWIAINLYSHEARCNVRADLLDTLVVDTASSSAKLLGSPDNIAGAIFWAAPGQLLVQTGRDHPVKINVQTGHSEEYPLDSEELLARQAESALRGFLRSLYLGRFDPAEYAAAERLFAGWEILTTRYATMRFTDNAAMLQYACEQDTFRCYPVRKIVFMGKVASGTPGASWYHFQVEFLDLNGDLLIVNGVSVFDFNLDMDFPEKTQIFQMPPLQ